MCRFSAFFKRLLLDNKPAGEFAANYLAHETLYDGTVTVFLTGNRKREGITAILNVMRAALTPFSDAGTANRAQAGKKQTGTQPGLFDAEKPIMRRTGRAEPWFRYGPGR